MSEPYIYLNHIFQYSHKQKTELHVYIETYKLLLISYMDLQITYNQICTYTN